MSRKILLGFAFALVASAALAATPPDPTAPAGAAPARTAPARAKPAAKPGAKATAKAGTKAAAKTGAKTSKGAATAPKLKDLPAEQIVERNVAARGGLVAWRAVSTLTVSGRLDAGGKPNVELPFVMRLKRGHKSRLDVDFHGKTAIQVFDGSQGWKVRPFTNRNEVEPYTAAEARSAAGWDELDGPLIDLARKGTRVERAGTERIEGHATYKLKLTSRSGEQRHVWIDAKTFLERKIEGEPRKLDGKVHRVAIHFREFRKEHGLTTPRVLETVAEGVPVTRKLTITSVTFNAPMPDALFEKPQLAALAASGR